VIRPARLRRARTLFAYWSGDRLVFENYRTRTSISADPQTVDVLNFFGRWRSPSALESALPDYDARSVRKAIRQLVDATVLVREGTSDARQDAHVANQWSPWLPHGAFHFGTRDTTFVPQSRVPQLLHRLLEGSRQPPFFKRYTGRSRRRLPSPHSPDSEFLRVLMARRTHREFSRERVDLSAISTLLFCTWGVTGTIDGGVLGRLPAKTSPSGGARHPGEVYLLALNVVGLPSGLYHYDPRRHALDTIRRGATPSHARRYCAGQSYVGSAAALFLMTAVIPRSMWKYRFARAYRVVLLDAGHLCQTFCLTATWLGLAPFCTAAIKDSLIERDIGIDGVAEVAMYVAGVGAPRHGAPAR